MQWVAAADWSVNESAYARLEYNDNRGLAVSGHSPVFGAIYNLQADLKRNTERTKMRITPRLRFVNYEGHDNSAANNQYLTASVDDKTERSYTLLNIDYTRDTPLTSEQQANEVVRTNKTRNRWNVSPLWSYQIDERDSVAVSLGYTYVHHQDADLTTLVDYRYLSGSASYSYLLNSLGKLTARIYGSRYSKASHDQSTNDGGVDFTYESKFTPLLDYSITLGWHQVTIRAGLDDQQTVGSQVGTLAGIHLEKRTEKGTATFIVENTVEPAGIGALVKKKRGSFLFRNHISESVSSTISMTNTFNKAIGDYGFTQQWSLREFKWVANFNISKSWLFSSSYHYIWQKINSYPKSSQSNAILFSLGYHNF